MTAARKRAPRSKAKRLALAGASNDVVGAALGGGRHVGAKFVASLRAEGVEVPERRRGHWPAGKPRGDVEGWNLLRPRVEAAVKQISRKDLAKAAGVSDRSLRRWLGGEKYPTAEHVEALGRALARLRRDNTLVH